MTRSTKRNIPIYVIFDSLREKCKAFPLENFSARLETLETEYKYMGDFMMQGYQDKERNNVFRKLVQRLEELEYDIEVRSTLGENSYVKGWMKQFHTDDTSAEALQSMLMQDCTAKEHHDILTKVFIALLTSGYWNEQQKVEWRDFIMSNKTNRIDALTIISAISLSCMEHMCTTKALCLAEIYRQADDEELRQRALVGCMFSLEGKDIDGEIMTYLMEDDRTASEIIEMQMQVQRCATAESDSRKINNTLMPDLIKSQPFKFTDKGIVERDECNDPTDLNSMERQMEEMEEKIKKVRQMQDKGTDIFFAGFKQMKRYPFFYKLINWFTPMYIEHPDIARELEKLGESKFLNRILEQGPFCDSDKYSFVIAFSSVMQTLPDNVKKMMEDGEMGPIGMQTDKEATKSKAFLRRQYLQDMFRYITLNPFQATKHNPFVHAADNTIWKSILPYTKNAYYKAEYYYRTGDNRSAIKYYSEHLREHKDHKPSMRNIARAYFAIGEYEKAAFYFDALKTLEPGRTNYTLNYCIAMVKQNRAGDVTNELYRLDFEIPGNVTIQNTLGWALLHTGKAEKAYGIYRKIPKEELTKDYSLMLNVAYSCMAISRYMDAVGIISDYHKANQRALDEFVRELMDSMMKDAELLNIYGIDEAEINIILSNILL